MSDDSFGPWHLDRRVPIALIVAIIMQSVAAVWWAATVTETIGTLTEKMDFNASGDRRQWDEINQTKLRVDEISRSQARVEGVLEHIVRQNTRILDRIDKWQIRVPDKK